MRKGRLESQLVQLCPGLVQLGMNKRPCKKSLVVPAMAYLMDFTALSPGLIKSSIYQANRVVSSSELGMEVNINLKQRDVLHIGRILVRTKA